MPIRERANYWMCHLTKPINGSVEILESNVNLKFKADTLINVIFLVGMKSSVTLGTPDQTHRLLARSVVQVEATTEVGVCVRGVALLVRLTDKK